MDRTYILVLGAICWSVVAVDALIHLATGDLVVPAAMAIVFAAWVGLRGYAMNRRHAEVAATA